MLERIDITNSRGNVFTLMMEENDSGYQVSTIDGLDPVKATFVSNSHVGVDGEQLQSAKRGARNIVINLDLDPDFNPKTYTDLRRDLYPFFMSAAVVTMRFYLETGLYVDIVGNVESMSSPLFEEDPTVSISLMCFQPDFLDPQTVMLTGATVANNTNTAIDYPGSIETGTILTLNVNRPLSEVTIYNMNESGVLSQLDFTGSLIAGDVLVINSVQGQKGVNLTRASVTSSLLYGRSAQSNWIQLFEGINQFRVYAEGGPVPYTLEYVVRYGAL